MNIVQYMIEESWRDDKKEERKVMLFNMAREGKEKEDLASKIGAMLLYNQVIEEILKDIVQLSINYIKAEIWPSEVYMSFQFSKSTFGAIIKGFEQYATIEYNRDILLKSLDRYNKQRNEVVHNLFSVKDLNNLAKELDEYSLDAEEIIGLLLEYDGAVCEKFEDLATRVDFGVLDK